MFGIQILEVKVMVLVKMMGRALRPKKVNKVFFKGAPPVNGKRITYSELFNLGLFVGTFSNI